jgi:tetratricopeptide (TPR) repeat protein
MNLSLSTNYEGILKMIHDIHVETSRTRSQNERSSLERIVARIGLFMVVVAVVCAAVLTVHWPALSAKALMVDDNQYLTDNMLVQQPRWASAWRFLTEVLEPSTVRGYYQPLSMCSLMFDCALGGRPTRLNQFHRTSLVLHLANVVLVIVLLYSLFGHVWVAGGVGLLFGLHPMTVECVTWVSERKTLLAAFFAFWCLVLYIRYARRSNWRLYTWCLLTYVLALMSKPTSMPLPMLMLLLDYWPLGRLNRKALLEKLPLFLVGGIFGAITYLSQSQTAAVQLPTEYGLEHIPLVLCHNIIFYLYKIAWPMNLSSHYPFPQPLGLSDPMVLAGVVGTCALATLLMASLRWTRAVLTGWLIFFVAILPTMHIIGFTNVIAASKFVYLPSFGLLILLASFGGWFCNTGRSGTLPMRRAAMVSTVLVLACAEAAATRVLQSYWQDTIRLHKYMLQVTPHAALLHNNLGMAFQSQGKLDEAIDHYREALQIEPRLAETHYNLGLALESQNRLDEALNHYRRAVLIQSNYAKAHLSIGNILCAQNKLNEAISHYRQAIQIKPNYASAYFNLGRVFRVQDNVDEAISHYRKALEIEPDNAMIHYNLGNALWSHDDLDEAIGCYYRALQIEPNYAKAHNNLGKALELQGKLDEAIGHYSRAAQIEPDDLVAARNLGKAFQSQGKLDMAVSQYRRVLNVNPDDVKTHNYIAIALHSQGKLDQAVSHYREVVRIRPDVASAHYNLAHALESQGKLSESICCYYEALQIDDNFFQAHYNLGMALRAKGRFGGAIEHLRKASRISPGSPMPLKELAWILATHRDPRVCDPNEAIHLAERAAGLTKYDNAEILDTLAAAYAAAGHFDRATAIAQKALLLASNTHSDTLLCGIRKRLELYIQAKPFTEDFAPTQSQTSRQNLPE